MPADQHHVRVTFRDTGSDRADTDFRNQLDVDPRIGVCILQVVDQLRKIFDRVDVVMRRWRNQLDTGCGMAHPGDPGIHLLSGQFAALAGLGALCHLDLQFLGIHQVVTGHAKTS